MFRLRPGSRADVHSRRASPPAPSTASGLPDIPSLEGYTIQELRTEQLVRLINFDELKPEQVANLIRAITRSNRYK
jgi:hypothetical protein